MKLYIYSWCHVTFMPKSFPISLLLPFLLTANLLPSTLSFKAGYVEQVPGSSLARNGPTGNSNSKNLMMKLTSPRESVPPHTYETSKPGFYGGPDTESESYEHSAPFVRFPTIPSPFSHSSETLDDDYQQLYDHNSHNQHLGKQGFGKKSSGGSSPLARDEASSLFAADEDSYYTTGSEAKPSSIDIDRYSQENDLYEKQTATAIKSPSVDASVVDHDDTNNHINNIPLSKPTLLPANYLSLAAFQPIEGALEKSSSSIISRIANFWRSMSNNNNNSHSIYNATSNNVGSGSNSSVGSANASNGSKEKSSIELTDEHATVGVDVAKPNQISDNEANEIETDVHHVLLTNSARNRTKNHSLHPRKYISVEDTMNHGDTSSGIGGTASFESSKQHYFNLDNEDDADGDLFANTEEQHDHQDHAHSHNNEHDKSVEDVSEPSSADQTFHEDLFHTTGTITAITQEHDLIGSSSTSNDHVLNKKAQSSPTTTSSTSGSSATKGEVKKAESDKIWSIDSHFGRDELVESEEDQEYYGMTIGGFLKRELWTIPLFVLAALNMILIILFEVYVLCRARGQSRRHLFLGQMLLFGLFLCSFLALMFAVHPSIIGCFVGRLGVGITYSLIFSVLMVKCVFLLSLDTGIYLPTSYQGILLFFAVMVQVAIDTQWVIIFPPYLQTVESGRSVLIQCGTSFVQLLYSLSYVGFLIVMVGFLAGRAAYKGVVENYRESVYILITAVVTIPVALSWTVAGWMLQGRHQDACVSFGLVAHSLTTFLIMFMPKGRQLASLDKDGVCFEDQEDQCSGYSPSFFHFKPTTKNYKTALWGDGNLYTTLEPTVSTINPNVFFHRNDFHSGMIY